MGGAGSMHDSDENYIQNFGRKTCRKDNYFRDTDVDGWIILKWSLNKYDNL
jgi:hypothetical protein